MNSLRFVHAADLHLDSPFAGFSAGAPAYVADTLRDATFEAYDAIIELCLHEEVDALLVAGDVYDGADRSLRAQVRFVDGLRRLSAAGIRSFVCHGNHDPLDGWEAGFTPPPGCYRFGPEVVCVPLDPDDPQRAMVYGYSYPRQRVVENVALQFARDDDAAFAIGLLHCNTGSNSAHAAYAPCSIEDLAATGIDYWALGHVHTRQVLREQHPAIVYPGNPQGRHPNETGARGVYLVEVGADNQVRLDFRPVDRVRWATLRVTIDGLDDTEALQGRIGEGIGEALSEAGGRPLVYRLELTGRGPLHDALRRADYASDLRDLTNQEWATRHQFAWCDRVLARTGVPFDREQALAGDDFMAQLLREFDDSQFEAGLLPTLDELYRHHGAAEYLRDVAPTIDDLPELLRSAEALCIDELEGAAR